MEMQEGRETGAFHIPQETAIVIWNDAKTRLKAATLGVVHVVESAPCKSFFTRERIAKAEATGCNRATDEIDECECGLQNGKCVHPSRACR
jgi:hypothetical protein